MKHPKLEAIRERLELATPGPWTVDTAVAPENWYAVGVKSYGPIEGQVNWREVCSFAMWTNPKGEIARETQKDAHLIAHAPTDIALLLREVVEPANE